MASRLTVITFFIFSICFTIVAHAQIPSAGLVAHWPFTGNAADSSGNGRHGNINNVTLAPGKLGTAGTAYVFNNTNAFIGIPYHSSFNVTRISMCAVLKPSDFYTGPCQGNFILSRGVQGSSGSLILDYLDNAYNDCSVADTNLYVFAGQVGTIVLPATTMQCSTKVHTNNWYCFVLTYDGTTAKYFINGTLINSFTGWSSAIGNSSDSISIGKYLWASGYPYNFIGTLDDVAFYNRALTDSEVNNYCINAPKAGTIVPDTTDTTNSISYHTIQNTIKLYPNPTKGSFTINGTLQSGHASIEILNTLGVSIYKEAIQLKNNDIHHSIDVNHVPQGMYLLKITSDDYSRNIKFIKQE